MNTIDLVIFIAYCALILFVGLFVSRKKKGEERDAGDYFLRGADWPGWAIGLRLLLLIFRRSSLSVCPVPVMQSDWQWLLTNGLRRWD